MLGQNSSTWLQRLFLISKWSEHCSGDASQSLLSLFSTHKCVLEVILCRTALHTGLPPYWMAEDVFFFFLLTFISYWICVYVWFSVKSDSFVTPGTVACQAPLSMGLPRQDYWSGLPFTPPWNLPDLGIKTTSSLAFPALVDGFFTTGPPRKPSWLTMLC